MKSELKLECLLFFVCTMFPFIVKLEDMDFSKDKEIFFMCTDWRTFAN